MNLQRSTDRILTTHVGSLPRPKDLLDLMKAKMTRRGYVPELYEARVRSAVAECVRKQAESGIDILNDGEQSKPGFFTYVAERLEGFFHALGAALRAEYKAIIDVGFLLQIDDPFLTDIFADPSLNHSQRHNRALMFVEAINESLRGIPAEKVRFHTCYGINEGPRIHDAPLEAVLPYMLKVNAGAYSFEAANPRHEHEYHVWERVKLPDDKVLIPGVITHASNIVEHPELIAERLVRFAKLVGRENVVAGADCGFSSQATYRTEVHPSVVC